jgi:hypothetical protein
MMTLNAIMKPKSNLNRTPSPYIYFQLIRRTPLLDIELTLSALTHCAVQCNCVHSIADARAMELRQVLFCAMDAMPKTTTK